MEKLLTSVAVLADTFSTDGVAPLGISRFAVAPVCAPDAEPATVARVLTVSPLEARGASAGPCCGEKKMENYMQKSFSFSVFFFVPSMWLQDAPFWQAQISWQSLPNLPAGHGVSQNMPVQPGGHMQRPVDE